MADVSTNLVHAVAIALGVALVLTLLLALKSLKDFTHSGPKLREEIQRYYAMYTLWAVARLCTFSVLLLTLMGVSGNVVYLGLAVASDSVFDWRLSILAAVAGIAIVTGMQLLRHLLYLPASLMASSQYDIKRLYPIWHQLSPGRLNALAALIATTALGAVSYATLRLMAHGQSGDASALALVSAALLGVLIAANWPVRTCCHTRQNGGTRPNILMIGSDTLRADRLGVNGNARALTPYLDQLATQGINFKHCFVPCARTAPSLLSLFTGAWPHEHGVRDNFVLPEQFDTSRPALPRILAQQGYRTCAVGDWSAADLGKFDLGFQERDLPSDQWNVKYLLRQGPKDLRLFLSLFTHGRLGKRWLPELYYLAGVPLSREVVDSAKCKLSELASSDAPFLLNIFMATTHPPFGSEHPYYLTHSSADYEGGSKFVMEKLNDPFDIIRRQGDARTEFDLDQIVNLYDGCVRSFDDKVRELVTHLDLCGLRDNTLIVIYSDHGMEFFEHETWGQGNSVLGDFSSRIPLLIIDPRTAKPVVVEEISRLIDVAPTLLDLIGITPPAGISGQSFAAAVQGQGNMPHELPALTETGIWLTRVPGLAPNHLHYPDIIELLEVPDKGSGTLAIHPRYCDLVIRAKDRAIRSGHWKLIYQPLNEGYQLRLYDVQADPECRTDLAPIRPEVTASLWSQLQEWMAADALSCHRPHRNGTTDSPAG